MNWRQAVRGALASREEWDAGTEQREARRYGSTSLAQCRARDRINVAGVIRSVTYPSSGMAPVLTAQLYDGSDSVQLVWLGRRSIAGIEPGRRLVIEGTLCEDGSGTATRVVYNPAYRLMSSS